MCDISFHTAPHSISCAIPYHMTQHTTSHYITWCAICGCMCWCSVAKHGVYCYMKRCGAMWNVVQLDVELCCCDIPYFIPHRTTPHVVVWCGKAWCSNIVTHSTSHHMHHSTSRITLHACCSSHHHSTCTTSRHITATHIAHDSKVMLHHTPHQTTFHIMHHSTSQKCDITPPHIAHDVAHYITFHICTTHITCRLLHNMVCSMWRCDVAKHGV